MNDMRIIVILCCLEKNCLHLLNLHSMFQIFYLWQVEFMTAEPVITGNGTYDYEHN